MFFISSCFASMGVWSCDMLPDMLGWRARNQRRNAFGSASTSGDVDTAKSFLYDAVTFLCIILLSGRCRVYKDRRRNGPLPDSTE